MLTAVLTFLGGATMRMLLGYLYEFATKWQDNRNELRRMELQGTLEQARHERETAALRLQAELGIKVIEVQAQREHAAAEDAMLLEATRATMRASGIGWVDAWNHAIRPLLASVCIALWLASLVERSFKLDDWDKALMSLALGVFVGGRIQATGR
jgi:hypothetical protein